MATTRADPPDFSLVLGGPLYQLYRRGKLATPHLELLTRRIIVISLFAWLPLLLLSLAQGDLTGSDQIRVPLLKDVAVHVRFLAALPLLIVAEVALGVLLVCLLIGLGPLLNLAPNLTRVRREGIRSYGRLASDYVNAFHRKWIASPPPPVEALVGSSDNQSLADLDASFDVIRRMRTVPFDRAAVVTLVAATAVPWIPLVLTVIPLEQLLGKVAGMLL